MNAQAILETLAGTFCCSNDQLLTLKTCGASLASLTGYSPEELESKFHNHLVELVVPEDRQAFLQSITEQLSQGDDVELEFQLRHKDGRHLWVLNKSRRLFQEYGSEYLCGLLTDVTRSRQSYEHTYKALEQYQIILAQIENIIFEWNFQKDTIFFSDTWTEIFGYSPVTEKFSHYTQENPHLHPEDLPIFLEHLQALRDGASYRTMEVRIQKADGDYLWCRIRATALHDADGKLLKIVGIIINIDAEKKAAHALKVRAERDALTKLLNQDTAHKLADKYLNAITTTPHCALLIIDLDNFKQVNDQSGHLFGDKVLIQSAKEIQKLFRSQDILARIGGDEFLVLMKDISDRELVKERCQLLINAFQTLLGVASVPYNLSCSIGVAFSPVHGISYYELFQHADQALYHAKALGKSRFAIYEEAVTCRI